MNRIAYSLIMLVAVVGAFWLLRRRQADLAISQHDRAGLAMAAFLGCFLGAKLPFILEYGWDGLLHGWTWIADGKTILGGIFGGYVSVELAKAWMGIRIRTGDSFAIPVAIAVFAGRLGCWVAGCCYGAPTTLPWGVVFSTAMDDPAVRRHPTQIYEMAFHALAASVLVVAHRRKWIPGHQLKAYLLSYLVYRFATEFLRPEPVVLAGLTAYQFACLPLAALLAGQW